MSVPRPTGTPAAPTSPVPPFPSLSPTPPLEAEPQLGDEPGTEVYHLERRFETRTGLSLDKLMSWIRKKWLWIGVAGVLLLAILSSQPTQNGQLRGGANPTSPSREKAQPASNVSWEEIDSIYSLSSKVTDLRKDEEWKKYKGKTVQWTGCVEEITKGMVGGLRLCIKMNPKTFTFDLMIY